MNLDESSAGTGSAPQVRPLLRTVLLCDIVESTALVERLGDMRAALMLQRHDQLLRQAITFCHGQLIDKADGVLALFERPIQALDFALRYQRGLRELGQSEGIALRARIGLHVGDVMMWANEPRDVQAGAKLFEVEGLAKPVAARLMNLALPGQILMSGMARNLCHRAVGELGDAGRNLRFLMHGRYRFKGVPAPMLIHEAGEPGLAPLRAPESGTKAWREVPLWRRPPVLALEVLLGGALLLGGLWTTLQPAPAIAFAERDWVVVADLQNRTGEALFDASLDTALRVGLEQSRHINLVPELQIDRALARMQRPGQPVGRQLATELALREGARAVILPTVADVGGVVRVSLEVIDPRTGVTVHSESADARGTGDLLAAVDAASRRVREHLGEAVASIEGSSRPLEQVTTSSIEALKAFSLAQEARMRNRVDEALPLYMEAVRLDPSFAMASLRLAFLRYIENDARGTREWLDRALAHRSHLSQRELLFLEAAARTLDRPEEAVAGFAALGALYPDEFRAFYNHAYFSHYDLLRSQDGLARIEPALSTRNPGHADAAHLAGVMALARNRYGDAAGHFARAESLGGSGWARERVEMHLAQRRYAEAGAMLAAADPVGTTAQRLESRLVEVEVAIDRGRWADAVAASRTIEASAREAGGTRLTVRAFELATLSLRSYRPDAAFAGNLRDWARALAQDFAAADDLERRHTVFQALAAGWMAAHTGDPGTAAAMLELTAADPLLEAYPANAAMRRVVEAELALVRGDHQRVESLLANDLAEETGLYFTRAVLLRSRMQAGDTEGALALATWLDANRGRAFTEANSLGSWQPANVLESTLALHAAARLAAASGDAARAEQHEAAFLAAWQDGDAALLERRDRIPARR